MKIELTKKSLSSVLNKLKHTTKNSSRNSYTSCTSVKFSVKNQQLIVSAINQEIEINHVVNTILLISEHDFSVDLQSLTKLLQHFKSQDVITLDNNTGQLNIKCNGAIHRLENYEFCDYQIGDHIKSTASINIDAKTLHEKLSQVSYAMAIRDVRCYLNGLLFDFSDSNCKIVATDGHRVALADITDKKTNSGRFIIPNHAIIDLIGILKINTGNIKIEFSTNFTYVKAENFNISIKNIDWNYPDYTRVIPKNNGYFMVNRLSLLAIVSQSTAINKEKIKGIKLSLADNNLHINSANESGLDFDADISVDQHSNDVKMGLNAQYLIDVLKVINADQIKIAIQDAKTCILIEDNHIIMPMRLKN